MSWKGLAKKKEDGGLGLKNPYLLNQTMGAKLWWRWMNGGTNLWKMIWNHKYNIFERPEAIFRYEEPPEGSTIWNLAANNRHLIHQHAF